jgi:hypothetical protein
MTAGFRMSRSWFPIRGDSPGDAERRQIIGTEGPRLNHGDFFLQKFTFLSFARCKPNFIFKASSPGRPRSSDRKMRSPSDGAICPWLAVPICNTGVQTTADSVFFEWLSPGERQEIDPCCDGEGRTAFPCDIPPFLQTARLFVPTDRAEFGGTVNARPNGASSPPEVS